MSETKAVVNALHEGMRQFLELVGHVRPDLHRYCARMMGSIADGEDVVQDALSRAYYALSEMDEVPELRPWLFRIAHHRALDHLGRYERRMAEPIERVTETAPDHGPGPEDLLAREQATRAALARFVELVPAQRSAVILKDVLGHSNSEIAELMTISESAAKALLHRGRERLQQLALEPRSDVAPALAQDSTIARYATLFNARDWDGVRALLAEDVRLDLVSRVRRSGRQVASYFSNYEALSDWHLVPGMLDAREVIYVFRGASRARPDYFIELGLRAGKVWSIRDFRYVPYILQDAAPGG